MTTDYFSLKLVISAVVCMLSEHQSKLLLKKYTNSDFYYKLFFITCAELVKRKDHQLDN